MKNSFNTLRIIALTTAMVISAFIAEARSEEVKIKIDGIRNASGSLMIAAGDPADMSSAVFAMSPAAEGSVTITMNIPEGDTALNIFHDENGNFNLDRDTEGRPTEGCYSGQISVEAGGGEFEAKLWYFEAAQE